MGTTRIEPVDRIAAPDQVDRSGGSDRPRSRPRRLKRVERRTRRRVRWMRARRELVALLVGLPLWLVPVALLVSSSPVRTAGIDVEPFGTTRINLLIVIPFAVTVVLIPRLTAWQRRRLRRLSGVIIAEDPQVPRVTSDLRSVAAVARSGAVWRQALYHVVIGPAVGLGVVLLGWLLVIGFVGVLMIGDVTVPPHTGGRGEFWTGVLALVFECCLIRFLPGLLWILTRADIRAARRLLGPDQTVELTRQVETLSESRAAAIEAADEERRRIERDLHDGAQQVLMSLAMNLGLARKTLVGVPEEAMKVIADAHQQAKEAMAELRTLVRGLQPAVLDDRGLDAALSGVAARSVVPVRLAVDVARPLTASVETAAYFVVAEGLANVAKHAQASSATVDVTVAGDLLVVSVNDDGVGGADAAAGTGLAGLARRVAAVEGTLRVSSPPGGPTTLVAELPCGV